MSTSTRLLTYDELRDLPDLGEHYELIDGVLIVPPSPFTIHALLIHRLMRIFDAYLVPRQLQDYLFTAPCDVRLGDQLMVQPDLVFVAPDGPAEITPGCIAGPPTLVVEILSPSNRNYDLVTKFGIYERAGVVEYWTVDSRRASLAVYALVDGRYVEQPYVEQPSDGVVARSVVLPGLLVDVPALFANIPHGIVE